MNLAITRLLTNLGIGFEQLVLIMVLLPTIVFYAKDPRLGLMVDFLLSGCVFMFFYAMNLNFAPALICCFLSFIGLALSLYVSRGSSYYGVA